MERSLTSAVAALTPPAPDLRIEDLDHVIA